MIATARRVAPKLMLSPPFPTIQSDEGPYARGPAAQTATFVLRSLPERPYCWKRRMTAALSALTRAPAFVSRHEVRGRSVPHDCRSSRTGLDVLRRARKCARCSRSSPRADARPTPSSWKARRSRANGSRWQPRLPYAQAQSASAGTARRNACQATRPPARVARGR